MLVQEQLSSSIVTHLSQVEIVPVAVGAGATLPVAVLVGMTVVEALVEVELARTVLETLVEEAAVEEALLVSRPRAEEVEDPP